MHPDWTVEFDDELMSGSDAKNQNYDNFITFIDVFFFAMAFFMPTKITYADKIFNGAKSPVIHVSQHAR